MQSLAEFGSPHQLGCWIPCWYCRWRDYFFLRSWAVDQWLSSGKTLSIMARSLENMSRVIGRLQVLLRVLLLKFLDLFFRFFNRFYHGKLPFFAAMIVALKFVAMLTKALRRSVA
ncbi:hypothetical protein B296_00010780 [Ensete ventricosum]|uniref:Uncharacterized protein n=1 Tax=Ensete ventricosum TaxID=4639 RepID=A0A426XPY0_ENSVE|nr:hypothetical protein B296_00010780 [Ensete ventricosum]